MSTDGLTDGRMDGLTDGRTDEPITIVPFDLRRGTMREAIFKVLSLIYMPIVIVYQYAKTPKKRGHQTVTLISAYENGMYMYIVYGMVLRVFLCFIFGKRYVIYNFNKTI